MLIIVPKLNAVRQNKFPDIWSDNERIILCRQRDKRNGLKYFCFLIAQINAYCRPFIFSRLHGAGQISLRQCISFAPLTEGRLCFVSLPGLYGGSFFRNPFDLIANLADLTQHVSQILWFDKLLLNRTFVFSIRMPTHLRLICTPDQAPGQRGLWLPLT